MSFTRKKCWENPVFLTFSPCICSGQRHSADRTVGGAQEEGVSGHREAASRLQGLQRENGRLQEQLRGSEELNATLRSELDLHRSIMAQSSSHHQEQDHSHNQEGSASQAEAQKHDGDISSQKDASEQPRNMNSGKYGALVTLLPC